MVEVSEASVDAVWVWGLNFKAHILYLEGVKDESAVGSIDSETG
jgi:hypothetical protein